MLSLLWLSPRKALLDLISFASKSNYKRFEYYECNNDELNLKSHILRHDMKDQRARSSRMCVLLLINGLCIMNWCFHSFSLLLKVVKERWKFTLLHVWRVRAISSRILACLSRFRSMDLVWWISVFSFFPYFSNAVKRDGNSCFVMYGEWEPIILIYRP